MPVEIHEFEVSPAPVPPATAVPQAAGAPAAPEPDLESLAQLRRLAAAQRALSLRTFSH
jgi:hypothetical protein